MNELAELYEFNDEPSSARPVPKVPKDRMMAELLKKHENIIWKYHDHDSLLENQTDENLTEEERKAAWEEFENEKRGFVNMGNTMLQQQLMSNINPIEIQNQYRIQYPHLTEEQVIAATRAYILQLQSGITRRPAYDKSHYQQEMARAKQQERQLYPGTFGSARNNESASSSSWQQQVLAQQRSYAAKANAEEALRKQRHEQAQRLNQVAQSKSLQSLISNKDVDVKRRKNPPLQMMAASMGRRREPETITLDDEGQTDEIVLEGSPVTGVSPLQ